jgi:hypothetical protein
VEGRSEVAIFASFGAEQPFRFATGPWGFAPRRDPEAKKLLLPEVPKNPLMRARTSRIRKNETRSQTMPPERTRASIRTRICTRAPTHTHARTHTHAPTRGLHEHSHVRTRTRRRARARGEQRERRRTFGPMCADAGRTEPDRPPGGLRVLRDSPLSERSRQCKERERG